MIGFAGHQLITLGPGSSVLSFEPRTLNGHRLAEGVASVQGVPGGQWVAVMYLDEERPRWYRIDAIDAVTGSGTVVYVHDTDDVGPLLPRKDRQILGIDVPDGWIVLADTFFPSLSGLAVRQRSRWRRRDSRDSSM